MPHGQEKSGNQEKSGKTKKNDKSQVNMGVFKKKSGKSYKNVSDIVSLNLQNSLYFKAFY